MNYSDFLSNKSQASGMFGFAPVFMPDDAFDFQQSLIEYSVRKGKSAIFANTGLGKTLVQTAWAQNIVQKTNGNVLILAPLAVSPQTVREAAKFGIECKQSKTGQVHRGITVTNYESLYHFNTSDFVGLVCDESGILKNFDGVRKDAIIEFMRVLPYRLLCTATPSPNDYIELGNSSEALGELGFMDMLGRFFKNDNSTSATNRYCGNTMKWRFKKHAQEPFWRWICSWARAVRKPSDLDTGFDDSKFILPPLIERQTLVGNTEPLPGELFVRPAVGLKEQRQERRMTIERRCEIVAEKVDHLDPALVWCHLNDEGDLLEKLIPDAVQVSGSDSDDKKEEAILAFTNGDIRTLITKPRIASFGLNLQHCAHMTFFPSHSFEEFFQGVRRCWRFGQKNPVTVDIISTQGETNVLSNLQRKAAQAEVMFESLVRNMNLALSISAKNEFEKLGVLPEWMSYIKS